MGKTARSNAQVAFMVRQALVAVGFAGAALFGVAFVLSYLDPLLIERAAREVVRLEVEKRVGEKVDELTDSTVMQMALKALGKSAAEIETTKREISQAVPQKVAEVIANMLKVDCECRQRLKNLAEKHHNEKLSALTQVQARLTHFVESAYAKVSTQLLREFRIFTGANAMVFALLAIVSFRRRAAAIQLILPALVLLGAAAVTGYLYLFGQDWLHTILFSQYVGLAYFGYLSLAIVLLADVVFNRARVCTSVINGALDTVGSGIEILPC
jgi:hypothetical protein